MTEHANGASTQEQHNQSTIQPPTNMPHIILSNTLYDCMASGQYRSTIWGHLVAKDELGAKIKEELGHQ